jgi:hypothetical protein
VAGSGPSALSIQGIERDLEHEVAPATGDEQGATSWAFAGSLRAEPAKLIESVCGAKE